MVFRAPFGVKTTLCFIHHAIQVRKHRAYSVFEAYWLYTCCSSGKSLNVVVWRLLIPLCEQHMFGAGYNYNISNILVMVCLRRLWCGMSGDKLGLLEHNRIKLTTVESGQRVCYKSHSLRVTFWACLLLSIILGAGYSWITSCLGLTKLGTAWIGLLCLPVA